MQQSSCAYGAPQNCGKAQLRQPLTWCSTTGHCSQLRSPHHRLRSLPDTSSWFYPPQILALRIKAEDVLIKYFRIFNAASECNRTKG